MDNKKLPKNLSFTDVLHSMLWDSNCITKLAKRLGKSPSTISQQLSPHCDHTYFSADNVLPALEVADNDEPLFWLASQRNYICVPRPILTGDKSKLEFELSKTTKEYGDMVVTYSDIMADGIVEDEEAVRFRERCEKLAAQALAMANSVDAAVNVEPLPKELPPIPSAGTDRKQ